MHNWIFSAGGPLLFLEARLRPDWHGRQPIADQAVTDYERACAVDGYVGLLPVGDGQGLVLGDEPLQTTWLPEPGAGGVFVRWVFAPNEAAVAAVLAEMDEVAFQSTGLTLPLKSAGALLFDSALPGQASRTDASTLAIALAAGDYEVSLGEVRTAEMWLLCHRLRRRGGLGE